MCEIVIGEPSKILKPVKAWKVVDGGGHSPYFPQTNCRPWTDGTVRFAKPSYRWVAENKKVTKGGLHVFFTREAANEYKAELARARSSWCEAQLLYPYPSYFYYMVIPVLVWGDAILFKDGAAVEFATWDTACADLGAKELEE